MIRPDPGRHVFQQTGTKNSLQQLAKTNQPTDQPTDQQTGQKQYVPHYYIITELTCSVQPKISLKRNNVLTKFKEAVLTSINSPPLGGHVFHPTGTIFKQDFLKATLFLNRIKPYINKASLGSIHQFY
ncbi:hypothetical protein DPMN_016033 [Dreissena polymorpha]|uniref:Uncharacterized protein n=1 Tax=Dreissena polymorpha TaxID=45954 RepID=A0A9D4NCD9_DREPO|nr:hypothetical protein DPMN_016033 [Dreissena polymorpha]